MSSDPEPATQGFPQQGFPLQDYPQPPSTPPAEEPMPATQPLPPTRAVPPMPPAPAAPPAPTIPRAPAVPREPSGLPASPRPGYGPPTYGVGAYGPQHTHPAYPYGSPGRYVHPGMLAAAADRERTMDVLKAAFMEGRLTKGEFDERTARVLAARTYAELHALVGDLPVGPGGPVAPAPYQAGYYQPLNVRRTNGFAVGSLVCGIVPFFGGIPAVILGHYARGQIRKSGERGDGMAVAGLILGYLWVSLWVLILLLGITHN